MLTAYMDRGEVWHQLSLAIVWLDVALDFQSSLTVAGGGTAASASHLKNS